MQWENLTSLDFEQGVKQCKGVGIIPVGVLEPHASHLPIGTDMFTAHWLACRAAQEESAIVFPAYPFGINIESAHLPGSLVIHRELVFTLLESICDEMARHGLIKIILLSGHGGNRFFLSLFVQTLPERNKPYVAYYADLPHYPGADEILETKEGGHACEGETSLIRYIQDDLVKMEQIPPEPFTSLKRNATIADAGAYSPVDWYAMYPSMYVGNATKATAKKGEVILEHKVAILVKLIQAVKKDVITPALLEEFLAGRQQPTAPASWTKVQE